MAARQKMSVRRLALKNEDARAFGDAHRASIDVLFFGQAGAIQGQLESSTEFRSNVGCVARAREKNALVCHLSFRGRTQTRGSLASSELAAD
jgi:hypothetical protein